MATTIPDLWSDDIKADVLSPLTILRAQATFLERKTQGILRAQVTSGPVANRGTQHQLDLIAPALNGYRRTLLTATYAKNSLYPVLIRADCFRPVPDRFPPVSMGEELRKLGPGQPPEDQREANTQEEFLELLRQVFQSAQVRSLIQSMIAMSNETQRSDEEPGEAKPPTKNDAPDTNGS